MDAKLLYSDRQELYQDGGDGASHRKVQMHGFEEISLVAGVEEC